MKRVFLVVLDSFGVGALPDAAAYGDEGSDTLLACAKTGLLHVPNLEKMGLFQIDGVSPASSVNPFAAYGRMAEASKGKDTTTGHWELAGVRLDRAFPVFPNGFPPEVIGAFERKTGRGAICNRPYSGTEVIRDYGEEHRRTGAYIVYTSADSVFQIAAHEEVIPLEELYRACETAREILTGEYAVGRVIARPFAGDYPFKRTENRRDFSLKPPRTLLNILKEAGKDVISVGKINDIFAGEGITRAVTAHKNEEGMATLAACAKEDFDGLCFVNLVDFDMLYWHRNDAPGYARALNAFDAFLPSLFSRMRKGDLLIVTADHGCDPSTPSTDHSREYVPVLAYGDGVKAVNLGTRRTFSDVAATVADYLEVPYSLCGASFLEEIRDDG